MTMTDIKPKYEMPVGIAYANIRKGVTEIYEKIFDRYCPDIPVDMLSEARRVELGYENLSTGGTEPVHKECAEAKEAHAAVLLAADDVTTGSFMTEEPGPISDFCPHREGAARVPDPEVIWVGRLLDGLVFTGVIETRKIAKNLINNIPAGRDFRESGTAGRFTGGGVVRIEFKAVEPRREMYDALRKGVFDGPKDVKIKRLIENGEAPTINMGTVIKSSEPGEILNSPNIVKPEQLAADEVDMWAAGYAETDFDPRIRLDNRYGLHYLKRGDRVIISGAGWPGPATPEFSHTWILCPPSEGVSLVQQDAAGDDVIQLSGMRA